MPGVVVKAKLKKGQVTGLENKSGVLLVKWHEKRDVLTISIEPFHSELLIATGKYHRDGDPILTPKSVIDYNHKKQGVDLSDQFNSYRDLNVGESNVGLK